MDLVLQHPAVSEHGEGVDDEEGQADFQADALDGEAAHGELFLAVRVEAHSDRVAAVIPVQQDAVGQRGQDGAHGEGQEDQALHGAVQAVDLVELGAQRGHYCVERAVDDAQDGEEDGGFEFGDDS